MSDVTCIFTNIYTHAAARLFSLWFSALPAITRGALLTAALIGLLRLIFRRVLSAKAKYYLWLLLALRLMLPIVPASPTSLLNFIPEPRTVAQAQSAPEAPEVPTASEVPVKPETAVTARQGTEAAAPAIIGAAPEAPEAPAVPEAPAAPKIPRTELLFWVWLAGAGLLFLIYGTLYAVTAIRLKQLPVCTDSDTLRVFLSLKRVLGIQGSVRLVSGGAGMLGGVFHSTIVLPVEQHGEDVSPILVHELLHYKYRDLRLFVLFRLLAVLYWFNPAVWVLLHFAKLDCEAACDQRVLETKLVQPDCYATALYQEGALHMKKGVLLHTTFGGSRHSLKRRIRRIAEFKRPGLRAAVLTAVLAVLVAACAMTGAAPTAEIQAAIVGAEEAESLLYCGYYPSGQPTAQNLTEDEITAQVSAMDRLLRTYYSADSWIIAGVSGDEGVNPRITDYEYHLRETWTEPDNLRYLVDGGVLSCKLSHLRADGDTAAVKVELVTYSNTIETDETGKFVIRCGGSLYEDMTYHLLKEDGTWKVQRTENPGGDAWMHPWSAELPRDTFDTFEAALSAAEATDGRSQCPYLKESKLLLKNTPESTLAGFSDIGTYIDALQPEFCHYGWTFDEHIAAGLLSEETGEWEYQTDSESAFTTNIEWNGKSLEAEFIFSVTQFTIGTDSPLVLSEVLVTVPSDVLDGAAWGLSLMEPWKDLMPYGGNGAVFCSSDVCVGPYLTEAQRELAVKNIMEVTHEADSREDALFLLDNWNLAGGEYKANAGKWQFNGTGIALYATRTPHPGTDDTSLPAMTNTPPTYGHIDDGSGLTYGNTQWGMTPEEVLAAEGLQEADFPLQNRGQNYSMEGPIPNHPEVESVEFEFHFTDLKLSLGLDFVRVQYNTDAVSYEELLALRTSQLGPPTSTEESAAHWDRTPIGLTLTLGKNGFLREMCNARGQTSATAADTFTPLDIEEYLSSVEPPNGHYGWTYEQHVEAGLLDPEQGSLTLEQDTEAGRAHAFTTSMELGGETVNAVYVFATTMATIDGSGKEVLTQVMVTPPEGIAVSKWVASFSGSFTDKLFESQHLIYKSPISVGGLLTESQQEQIMDTFRAHNNHESITLGGWSLVQNWYQQNARIWHFNGTGAALYLTTQAIQ